ncbi:hypothetical protein A4X09_0g6478 [Tilletia walkeri]|uniref:Uncharacterized protein n=1 Tax=Tilletia walkeri TaxID=117179 RepID=A0A8X7N5C4_9BASI|nr:hypothetical protein A4X09_0g6478 [Tilletia walkeri]
MLRAISAAIFPPGQAENADQVRQRITGIVKKYHDELRAMSITGQGLLLEEMYDGHIKNAREELLSRCPWWDTMHEMMRDRGSSEPEELVTGAGSIYSQPTPSLTPTQGTTVIDSVDDFSVDGIPEPSLRPRSGIRKRPNDLGFNFEDEDMEDVTDLEQAIGTTASQSSVNTPSTSRTTLPLPSRASTSRTTLPLPNRARPLPPLGQLAGDASRNPMNKNSVGSSIPSASNTRSASPGPTPLQDKGKTPVRGGSPLKHPKLARQTRLPKLQPARVTLTTPWTIIRVIFKNNGSFAFRQPLSESRPRD